jgi:phytoene dehydrogenase-like protein
MSESHVLIIGGGMAGLSAGCYALRSGFRATIVEHNLALGGVCTAWQRGPYTVDGCIHWLTGGEFSKIYDELGILERVPLNVLSTFTLYRNAEFDVRIPVTRDLDALAEQLAALSRRDADEVHRLVDGARSFLAMKPNVDAPELATVRDNFRNLWEARSAFGPLAHFRKDVWTWAHEHIHSPLLRRFFTRLAPDGAGAFLLLMVLGYLEQGYLSRPVGGTAAFREALEREYQRAGGQALLHSTVDEILVQGDRACGVRLTDGTILDADFVLSTASSPETVLRLLSGRYDAAPTRERMSQWRMFSPIVLASFGVELPLRDEAPLQIIDGILPYRIGERTGDSLYVRVCSDEPAVAPVGHTVVQTMLETDYEYWATRGTGYGSEKDAVAQAALEALEPHFPGLSASVRMTDVATPLTYWSKARSWRGAYEGWIPTPAALFSHPKKKLAGLSHLYMAGQWVEPGGGVPTALMSGRHAVQLLCADAGHPFVART